MSRSLLRPPPEIIIEIHHNFTFFKRKANNKEIIILFFSRERAQVSANPTRSSPMRDREKYGLTQSRT